MSMFYFDWTRGVPIVMDNGSSMTKVGFAGDDLPISLVPSIVGRPKHRVKNVMIGMGRDSYVGEEAQDKRGVLNLKRPIERGVIKNWDDMEKIWHYTFYNELRVDPKRHPILVTEAPMSPRRNREKTIQVMFESFDVPAFFVANQAVLSLYAAGRSTGVVFESGDGVSNIVAVYNCYSLSHVTRRLNLAGSDLTDRFVQLLQWKGLSLKSTAEWEIAKQMKEAVCYIRPKPSQSPYNYEDRSYLMPDGQTIAIGSESFECPEALFDPLSIGKDYAGVHEEIYNTIVSCELDIRRDLYRNVVLSGGNTMFEGFADRLHDELSALAPAQAKVKIVTTPDRKYSAWVGGSILASMNSFKNMWITRREYDEYGPRIAFERCA